MTTVTITTAVAAAASAGPALDDRCRPQRVLVVDENELMQVGLRSVLAEAEWVESCLMAGSAEAALLIARRHLPQMVLISTSLGGRSGVELCRQLKATMPHVKIVLMSGEGRVAAGSALSVGAAGALSKHTPRQVIVSMLRKIADGVRVFPKSSTAPEVQLSRRENDVLQYLANGLSNPEMASVLNLSRHTVKQHTSSVYRKLGVRNRAEAASRAQELGLVGAMASSPREQLRAG